MRLASVPYRGEFIAAGRKHGVDPALLAAQAWQESMAFNQDVIACRRHSPAGARGISQWMPATARSWKVDPCNVHSAIDGQARYMAGSLKLFNGREDLALASYNAGIKRVQRLGRVPRIRETQVYVGRILEHRKQLAGLVK